MAWRSLWPYFSRAATHWPTKLAGDKVVLDLTGSWEMEGVLPGEGVKKLFHKVHPDCGPAFVPGDVYTDLWRVGRIDDPHVGRNGQRAKWVMDYEWWYFKTFKVPPEMKGKQIRLMFEGVDYECDVWLNGEALGNHQGAYSRFHFDITGKVNFSTDRDRTENNLLAVRLAPPPRTFALVCGRKYRWHGDYGNNVTPFGIWRPVRLEATGPVSIEDIYVQSELRQDHVADLNVQVTLHNKSNEARELDTRRRGARRQFLVSAGLGFRDPSRGAWRECLHSSADGREPETMDDVGFGGSESVSGRGIGA